MCILFVSIGIDALVSFAWMFCVQFRFGSATAMCCLFRFLPFSRIVFIWFGRLCVSSAHIISYRQTYVLLCIILWWLLLWFVLLRFGWTSEIITFKLKLYLGYIISVNILQFFVEKNPKRHEIFPPIFAFRPPHSHNFWPIFCWIKLAVEWPFVCQRLQCIDRERVAECRVQSELMKNSTMATKCSSIAWGDFVSHLQSSSYIVLQCAQFQTLQGTIAFKHLDEGRM